MMNTNRGGTALFIFTTLLLLIAQLSIQVNAFVRNIEVSRSGKISAWSKNFRLYNSEDDADVALSTLTTNDILADKEPAKLSLEEKMKQWDATEEELKEASLGGLYVGKKKDGGGIDGFDVGLWIMFPLMVGGSLLFAIFPLIMENIDTSSVGPPPMI